MEVDKESLGMRIHNLRREKGLTLEIFGKLIDNAGKSVVSKWERGVTIPNNKRLKIIASLDEITVFRLLYGSGVSYLFNNYEKLMSEKYNEIKGVISADSLYRLGEVIETEVSDVTDFEGVKRIIDKEFPTVEKEIFKEIDRHLEDVKKYSGFKEEIIRKLKSTSSIYTDEEERELYYIFEKNTLLSYQEKIELSSRIGDITSYIDIIALGKQYFLEDDVYVIKKDHLINNIKTLNLEDDERVYSENFVVKSNKRVFPLKYENYLLNIELNEKLQSDFSSGASDLLVYYFPDFKHTFLKDYFINTKMVIMKGGILYLGTLDDESVFHSFIDGDQITFDLKNRQNDIFYFPLLAIYY